MRYLQGANGMLRRFGLLAWLGLGCGLANSNACCGDDWPQWRGPNRTNVSTETGLLSSWPTEGPPLAWEAKGLGDGVVPVSVADGRVFCTGYRGEDEFCTALSEADGTTLWSVRLGPAVKELANMRWLNQRTPTVDGTRVHVVTVLGDYICLESATGKEHWRVNAKNDFGATLSGFGFCDYPLVDGESLIISPGGPTATLVALNKQTGQVVWRCSSPDVCGATHAALAVAELGGERQYVNAFGQGLIGVRAPDGELRWTHPMTLRIAVTHSPLIDADTIFYASGYAAGHTLFQVFRVNEQYSVREIYAGKLPYSPWLGSLTQIGDSIFCNPVAGPICLERSTGKVLWTSELGRGTYTIADGKLVFWSAKGELSLIAADPTEYRLLGEFKPFKPLSSLYGVSFPVVANGRLLIRDLDTLRAFDVRERDTNTRRIPDAVFVPTPDDVVPQLLDLAALQSSDVVYDLGSGDGRLLIAAAQRSGCRAVGIEIDPALVEVARKSVEQAGLAERIRIDEADLFATDFSRATVLTLYILPEMLERLTPKFRQLQPGSRIVSHEFAIPGIRPTQVIEVTSAEDGAARKLYLYTTPLQNE